MHTAVDVAPHSDLGHAEGPASYSNTFERYPDQLNVNLAEDTPSDPGVDFAIGEDEDAISTAPQTSGHTATGEALRINIPPGRLCVICRETMRPDNILKQLPKCKHVFCAKCIDPWLQLNPRCPLCRRADSAAKRAYIEHESNNPDVASQLNPQVVIRYVEVQVQMQRRRTLLGRCYLSAVVCLLLIIVFQFILQ
ncbi:hypothetical protein PTTG_27809 [Puccinia triticina 1-1 BBBD Race 1]|uniref:RING-type domain-containing protein n=1 Tax=Puccinia triticina (isolate 1-1 / race 1 (BBBD)) TaxID=630390 RepID=A0A180GGV7_PUCT1|nr:hypothetical protein PTTG_27809 [Puccinia triticina 1-1 BBBD Race 1]